MTIEEEPARSEKRYKGLAIACCRYTSAVFIIFGVVGASAACSEEHSVIEGYLGLGYYGPHGYGETISVALNIKGLQGLKPFAGLGHDITSTWGSHLLPSVPNFSFHSGIGYKAEFATKYSPSLTLSSLFRTGGNQAQIFLVGGWLDLVKYDNFDFMIGAAFEIANGRTPGNTLNLAPHHRTRVRNVRSFILPTWSVGFRVP